MNSLAGKVLDRIFVVLGAFLFFQLPLFIHQYQHQLIGHVSELRWQIQAMHQAASQSGKDVDQYIQKFIIHEDRDFSLQGMTMKQVQSRWEALSTTLSKLQKATIFSRPFVFLYTIQWDVLKSTAASFEPGISLTLESFIYALLGMGIGYLFFLLVHLMFRRILLEDV